MSKNNLFPSISALPHLSLLQYLHTPFSSVTQSCLTLCNPMDCNMPGFPVQNHLPELIQIHVHWVGDAIQPFHPLSSSYSGLISFRIDWISLKSKRLKSLLQNHNPNVSFLQLSAFFMVQLSHAYMMTGKTIALTRQTFIGKVMPFLFNMLSRLITDFLPRSKCLLISGLQSPSAVILELPTNRYIKSVTIFIVFASICHEVMGLDIMILVSWMLSEF